MPKGKKNTYLEPVGVHYGRRDIERIGVFTEASYMNGKGYVSPHAIKKTSADKGFQMIAGGPKSKNATQDGYFNDTFMRIFTKEAYSDPIRRARQADMVSMKKNLTSRPFYWGGTPKKHATPGDCFGTFTDGVTEFSPLARPKPKYVRPQPNLMTNPGRKGGPGYIDICLSKYPEHIDKDFYDESRKRQKAALVLHKKGMKGGPLLNVICPQPYFEKNPHFTATPVVPYRAVKPSPFKMIGPGKFIPPGPAKRPGGCKAGCFDKYPAYKNDQYKSFAQLMRAKRETNIWYPNIGIRTMFTCSTVNHNTDYRVHAQNWTTYTPTVFPVKSVA